MFGCSLLRASVAAYAIPNLFPGEHRRKNINFAMHVLSIKNSL